MKSATTYIQGLCQTNSDRLAEQGIFCPAPGANFAAVNVLLGSSYIRPWNENAWDDLATSIRAHDGDVFLSNEILSLRSRRKAAQLVAALAPAEVHLLLTARDLARVMPSQWQEGTVNQQTATWAEFADSVCSDAPRDPALASRFWRRHDLPEILQRWGDSVPPERTTLLTVPRGMATGELAVRCGAALDADFSAFEEPASSHSGLGAHSAELMRRLNFRLGDVDTLHYRTGFHKALARSFLANRAAVEPRIGLSAANHEWATRKAFQMVKRIEPLDVAVVGDLSELVPGPYSEDGKADPGAATDAQLLAAALDGLTGVTLRLAKTRIASDELRRQHRENPADTRAELSE